MVCGTPLHQSNEIVKVNFDIEEERGMMIGLEACSYRG